MPEQLRVLLHGELAATLEIGRTALATNESAEWTPLIARLSAAWDTEPSLATFGHWLEACLPENGARRAFEERAAELKLDLGHDAATSTPVDLLWANTDADYAGAVSFQRTGETAPLPAEYTWLSIEEIGIRLHAAWRLASQPPKGKTPEFPERRSSLSGVRGKIGLTLAADGTWRAATGTALNTWIAKREHDPRLPGEAGIESICQRALAHLELPAARTYSRVLDGEQAVLSERSDRYYDESAGVIRARHQEEFCQATGWPSALKYDRDRPDEPRWERAYALLRDHAPDPAQAQATLTAVLAATWGLGHVDLHRRNLGLLHAAPEEPFGIDVAPMYDVSSGVGIENQVDFLLAIGIGRQRRPSEVGPVQWLEHARTCGQDPTAVVAIVSSVLENLPDALADARREAREEDENVAQAAVNRRANAINSYAERRARAWTENLARLQRRNARGLDATAAGIARELRRLEEIHGPGDVKIDVEENGTMHLMHIDPKDQTSRSAGTANSTRTVAEALVLAGKKPPYDVPELELTLETERARELALTRTLER